VSDILYIINPAGHGGAGTRVWKKVQTMLSHRIDPKAVRFTERQGHAREIAMSSEGCDVLAAIGGDGTVGEVLSGVMAKTQPRPRVAIIPAGTGNDIGRAAGIYSVDDALAALDGGHAQTFDLIRIACEVEGRKVDRYALLHGVVGFSSIPMIRPWMKRYLGPTGAYYLATLLACIAYRAPRMTVRWGAGEFSDRAWIVIVSNVERSAGGSMCLGPGARPDDGELNVTIIPSGPKLRMMARIMPKIASGAHVKEPEVLYFPAREIEVGCDSPSIVEVDGDVFGMTPARLSICPRAVEILSPP
jgi:YegS/Rv2252/BmrU family lipid kinase